MFPHGHLIYIDKTVSNFSNLGKAVIMNFHKTKRQQENSLPKANTYCERVTSQKEKIRVKHTARVHTIYNDIIFIIFLVLMYQYSNVLHMVHNRTHYRAIPKNCDISCWQSAKNVKK